MNQKLVMRITLVVASLIVIGCSAGPMSSPSATWKTQNDAWQHKDPSRYKDTMSKASWAAFSRMLQSCTSCTGSTALEKLAHIMREPHKQPFETRKEKIDGDKATLEVKNEDGEWVVVPFVKENGEWKSNL
jgi:hypothetical protein